MTFAAPLFLLAALAAAIPVVLHMMHRRRAKDQPFPTLRFLRVSVERTRRRKRVEDVLLMLLRTAALLLLALGLARPAWTSFAAMLGGGETAAAIVLDNSASMGLLDEGRARFETARLAARQVLDELREGDQAAVLLSSGPRPTEAEALLRDPAAAAQWLDRATVSYEGADLAARLQTARRLLAESTAPHKIIYLLTDMQATAWPGPGNAAADKADASKTAVEAADEAMPKDSAPSGDRPSPATVSATMPSTVPSALPATDDRAAGAIVTVVVDTHRAAKPDVAVQKVAVEAAVPVAGMPLAVAVDLLNASEVAQRRRVELWLDDERSAVSDEIELPPGASRTQVFTTRLDREGLHRGEARLAGEDGSGYDDRRFFTVDLSASVPAAIFTPARAAIDYLDDAFYLERALRPVAAAPWAIRPSVLLADDLMSEPLERYRVVYCVNLPAPNAAAAARLREFVEAGGTLFWIAGDNVDPEAYNAMNDAADASLLPAALGELRAVPADGTRDSWQVSYLDGEYPPLRALVDPPSLYQSVLVYRHVPFEPIGDRPPRVLARLDDGAPLLIMREQGAGKLFFLGTAARMPWTNLPLRNLFVPLMAQLTLDSVVRGAAGRELSAGQPIVAQWPEARESLAVEVLPPTGETVRIGTGPAQRADVAGGEAAEVGGQELRYTATHDIGIYLVRPLAAGAVESAYAVNVERDEALPAVIARDDLAARLAPAKVVFAENPDDLRPTFRLLRQGTSLWGVFLVGVLLALISEALVANRRMPPADSSSPAAASPKRLVLPGEAAEGVGAGVATR